LGTNRPITNTALVVFGLIKVLIAVLIKTLHQNG